jgi:cytochrome c
VKASDCKTCHHSTNKIIGPSHTDVAKKYEFTEANVKLLASKIISGGQGVWGEIPMAAHADLTPENAESMARYVLSLDGEKEH